MCIESGEFSKTAIEECALGFIFDSLFYVSLNMLPSDLKWPKELN